MLQLAIQYIQDKIDKDVPMHGTLLQWEPWYDGTTSVTKRCYHINSTVTPPVH